MFWHLLITPFVALLNGLYAALPAWTLTIGSGAGGGEGGDQSTDHSFIHYALLSISGLDKWLPLHDGLLPLMGIGFAIFVGLSAFKAVKFVLSLIPTINAGG